MLVSSTPQQLRCDRPRAVALGTFDGVHAGHRSLIARAVDSRLRSTVITFHPHPRLVLGRGVQMISSVERRLALIEQTGVEDALVLEFTLELARLPAEAWVRQVLEPIGTRRVIIGENFRFGHKRGGDAGLLRRMGFDVVALPLMHGTSSSRIRDLVAAGDLAGAERELGRPYELEGVVGAACSPRRGASRSLALDEDMLLPPAGVYDARVLGRPARVAVGTDPAAPRRALVWLSATESPAAGRRLRVELCDLVPPILGDLELAPRRDRRGTTARPRALAAVPAAR